MDKDSSLVKFNQNLINQIGNNFDLVDKLLNKTNLESWWNSIDETWKAIFKNAINIDIQPNAEQLNKIIMLQELYCVKTNIKNLDPLRIFVSLNNLNLMRCENIDSVEPLRNCKEMKVLGIWYTKVENIEIVKHFHKLEELYLSNYVTSLKPIEQLINLKKLFFRHALSITSLNMVTKLVNIEELVISDSISDLSPIDKFQKLKRLVCYGVSDLEANRFKATHPNTEIIFGEKNKKKNAKIVEQLMKKAETVRKDGLNEDEKKIFGLK